MELCSVEGCTLARYVRGFCQSHYDRLRYSGELTAAPLIRSRALVGWSEEIAQNLQPVTPYRTRTVKRVPNRTQTRTETQIKCRGCGQEKPGTEFRYNSLKCFECYYKQAQAAYVKSRTIRVAAMKARKYNTSVTDMAEMQNAQKACAICRTTTEMLVIDHCHIAGHVRQLLCDRCNHLLGHAKDNPAILRSAALYLERHKPLK